MPPRATSRHSRSWAPTPGPSRQELPHLHRRPGEGDLPVAPSIIRSSSTSTSSAIRSDVTPSRRSRTTSPRGRSQPPPRPRSDRRRSCAGLEIGQRITAEDHLNRSFQVIPTISSTAIDRADHRAHPYPGPARPSDTGGVWRYECPIRPGSSCCQTNCSCCWAAAVLRLSSLPAHYGHPHPQLAAEAAERRERRASFWRCTT